MIPIMHYLKKYKPQLLVLIFLGYAPFLGESFRFGFLPISGFIIFAFLFTLFNLREFKQFLLEKNSPQFWWILIMIYCVINTLLHWGQYTIYSIYIDLGPCAVLLFGLFFGKYLSDRLSLSHLFAVMSLILVLLSAKSLFILLYQIPLTMDTHSIFMGAASFSYFPRIMLHGENSFLISIFVLCISVFMLHKNTTLQTIALVVLTLLSSGVILLAGWRSMYLAIGVGLLILLFFTKKMPIKKYVYSALLICISLLSMYILTGRDAMTPGETSWLSATPGRDQTATSNLQVLNANTIDGLSRGIPLLNSVSLALKIAEYSNVVSQVSDHWVSGLGMGASAFTPAIGGLSTYVHSQPFWLFLKGGVVLALLFYAWLIYFLYKKYNHLIHYQYNVSGNISFVILISLCAMDLLTNQFPTLSGSFYLGFWMAYMTNQSTDNINL